MTFPAGWYPDPDEPDARRYWDGASWSAPLPRERDAPAPASAVAAAEWEAPRACAVGPCNAPRAAGSQFCAQHSGGRNVLASIPPGPSAPSPPPPQPVREFAGVVAPSGSSALVCPHCGVQGRVRSREVKQKKGISGGKATGAVLTAGFSILATGLSRKERVTEMRCGNCGTKWHV